MGLPNAGEKTLIFHKISGCMCAGGCQKKMSKQLHQNNSIVSIDFDENEETITIQGSNLDPNMVIKELDRVNKKFELITEYNPTGNEEVAAKDEMEDSSTDESSAMVVYKQPPTHNRLQFIDSPALTITSHSHSRDSPDHDLELKNYDKRFTCNGCKEDGFRKRYRCKHCDYELHEDCKHPKPTVSHELFGESVFQFSYTKPTCSSLCRVHTNSCEACGNEIHGYSYHCESRGLYLHPMCVNFKGKICIEGETFTLKNKTTFQCFWCNDNEKRNNTGWGYVSERTKSQLHVNCVARIAHQAWKEHDVLGGKDAYLLVLEKRLNWGLVKKNNKTSGNWSKGGKLVKMILVFARTIIGIFLGDPTVILASMVVEAIKN